MLPIPQHMKPIFHPLGEKNNEFRVSGELICSCGEGGFELEYVAEVVDGEIKVVEIDGRFFLIINARCSTCKKYYTILDKDFHGWNGFVNEGFGNRVSSQPVSRKWHCRQCNHMAHRVQMVIYSKGKEDFLMETEGELNENEWAEAFSWISIDLICEKCRLEEKEWINYETM